MNDYHQHVTELQLQQYCVSALIDDGFDGPDVKVHQQYRLEYMAHQLTASFRTPAQVLQEDRVIATYPSDWWQAIKARLGFAHKTTKVYLTEHLIYPKIIVPKQHAGTVKLYTFSRVVLPMTAAEYFEAEAERQEREQGDVEEQP